MTTTLSLASAAAAVELGQLRVQYGKDVVIDGLDLTFRRGEFTCLLGPSGCGKSTILRIIGDLLEPAGGHVEVLGRAPDRAWADLAYVFQAPRLVPWRSAVGNVILGMQLRGVSGSRRVLHDRAMAAMSTVGIAELAARPAHVLSGGEQQRVSLARALAVEPQVLLMDEPFSALDVQTRRQLRAEIRSVWQQTGLTIVFVTHDVDEALIVADRVIVFSPKPTQLLADVAVDLPRPIDPASSEFAARHSQLVDLFAGSAAATDELTGHTT